MLAKMQAGKEKREGRSAMVKDLDPRNKVQPTQGVRAGSTVTKAPRIASSGFSLKPE
jgi:hypothetical protein